MPRRSPRFLVPDSALLVALNDDLLGHALQLLAPTALARTARVCKRLRGLAADERKRRVKTHGGAAIEAWLGGAKVVQRTAARSGGYNALKAYPDGSRLVGAGAAGNENRATVYKPDGKVEKVLGGHERIVCSELQAGYTCQGKLPRAAYVMVSAGASLSEPVASSSYGTGAFIAYGSSALQSDAGSAIVASRAPPVSRPSALTKKRCAPRGPPCFDGRAPRTLLSQKTLRRTLAGLRR